MRALTAPDFESLRRLLARDASAARAGGSLSPLRVVAPSERARRTLRTDLAERLGGMLAIQVSSWPGWLDEMTLPEVRRRGGTVLGEAGFDQLVSRVLEEQAGSTDARRDPLLKIAGTPGLARSVAATFRDLLEGGFAPENLDAADAGRDPLRASLFRLFQAFRAAQVAEGLWDRRRREALAGELAANSTRSSSGEAVYLFGFHDLTPLQRQFVEAVDRQGTPITLLIPGPGARTEPEPGEGAVAPLLQWLAERGVEAEITERTAPSTVTLTGSLLELPGLNDPGGSLELATYATEAAEVRGIAGRVLEELDQGRSPGDILITVAPGGPSAGVFDRIFASAEIPLDDRVGVPGNQTTAGRRALVLVRGLTSPDDDDKAGLAFLPKPSADPDTWRETVDPFLAARTAVDACDRFRILYSARLDASPTREIEDALLAIETVHGQRPTSPREFTTALGSSLATGRARATVERSGADTPTVLLVSASAARFERRSFVIHANRIEGSMRAPTAGDPLLSDRARRELNDRHEHEGRRLTVREDQREEHLLLARFAFEASDEHTLLSWSERARTGSEVRNPDGLLLDLANRRAKRSLEAGTPEFAAVAPYPDPDRARNRPVDPTDLDLALLASGFAPSESDLTRVLQEPRARHLGQAMLAAERRWTSPRLTDHDGVLSDERAILRVERMLHSRSWSPTALEALANCPFAYLLRLLKLDDERPVQDDYDPLERGRLFHEWLERVYRRLLREGDLPLDSARLPRALAWLEEHVEAEDRALRSQPRRRRIQRRATLRSLRDDVAILLARESQLPADQRPTPVRIEMGFGREGEDEAGASLALGNGEHVPLRGKIDRVDQRPDGNFEVVDYKTGRPRAKSGALRFSVNGKEEVRLQLPIYLEAARSALGVEPARAYYSFATTGHDFQKVEFTANDLAESRSELDVLLPHLLGRARAGWFPCTPGQSCCSPDLSAACGPGVVPRFHRKSSDPELSHHLDVVRGRDTNVDS